MTETTPTAEMQAARARLTGRYPRSPRADSLGPCWPEAGCEDELADMIASGDNRPGWQHPALYLRDDAPGPLTGDDVTDALVLSAWALGRRLRHERQLIDMARRRNVSWGRIAKALGLADGRAAQRHHKRLVDQVGAANSVYEQENLNV